MKIKKEKIVIVGGGFGGVKTALDLSKFNKFDITLISDDDNFKYYPSLYRTATGGTHEVSCIPLDTLLEPDLVNRVYGKVTALDRAQKVVKTEDGKEYEYDYLVLSLGVVTNFFGIEGLDRYAYGVKTLKDAEALKVHLHQRIIDTGKPDLRYVIVGGGPTGIELAGVLGEYVKYICRNHGVDSRKIHVDLIEAAPRLLPRMPKSMSKKVAKRLKSIGVRLYTNAKVEGQTADKLIVNGKPIRSHTVIWTAGMANNPFFKEQGFQLGPTGRVRVNQYLMAEPSIFVIGDNADTPYSGMAQTAIYDGQYIARSLATMLLEKETPEPYVAKKPIYVFPAGEDWAAVLWGRVKLYGRIGSLLRRAADFSGYKDYEDFFRASKQWFSDYEKEDLCALCQPDEISMAHHAGR